MDTPKLKYPPSKVASFPLGGQLGKCLEHYSVNSKILC